VRHEENAGPGRDAGSCALTGRVALVTGASGGIGTALVMRLLGEGVRVVATTRRPDSPGLAALHAEHPDRLRIVQADMGEPERLPDLVRRVEDESGRLDLLLPNAGAADVRSLGEVTLAEWRSSLEVNLTAPFVLAQAAAGGMCERGFGRILFTSSVAAYVGGFVGPHYAAAKAGLHGLVHFLSSRLAGDGVTANAIAPALIGDTAMISALPSPARASIPAGRLGRPGEVADLAVAILRNGYLTGQVVLLDGGIHPT
jgi:3-oxoacyl-[acyl-carrier protein] reductase